MALDETALRRALAQADRPDPAAHQAEIAAVIAEMSLYDRHEAPLVRIGEGCGDARPESLARHVMRYTTMHGVDGAIAALRDLDSITTVRTATYVYVENVTTDRIIDLGADVTAMPDTASPHAGFTDAISQIKGGLVRVPGAILCASQEDVPFLRIKRKQGITPFDGLDLRAPGLERIDTAIKMLTVCGPAFPSIRARTTTVATNALRLFHPSEGVMFDYPGYSLVGARKPITDEPRILTPFYNALNDNDGRRVDVAIGRLGLSVAKQDPGDAIVDLAIALEALLSDKGNKDELTYRLRIRASLFLADRLEDRVAIREAVKALYSERSGIVHGDVPKKTDPALRSASEDLVGRLIRKVLLLGSIPDWGIIELTGGAHSSQPNP